MESSADNFVSPSRDGILIDVEDDLRRGAVGLEPVETKSATRASAHERIVGAFISSPHVHMLSGLAAKPLLRIVSGKR
jgi:hypothetical protein